MKVSIVGMPNAGKSTLFNKLCGKQISISFDEEGTTVDYISYTIGSIILVDTCGVNGVKSFEDLSGKYILDSDLILYVIDGRLRPRNFDVEICKFLRKKGKKIWLVCNKAENSKISPEEARIIPYEEIFYTSAEHSLGIHGLQEALNIDFDEEVLTKKPLIAIVGRANSGKSTLMNCLIGQERSKVEDKIGTTRDSVFGEGKTAHNCFSFMDTAGYRSERSPLEYITRRKRERSLSKIDGAILILDGELGLTKTDKQIFEEILDYAKFIVVAINKSDILTTNPKKDFRFFNLPDWIPMIQICAKENKLGKLREIIDSAYSGVFTKIATPDLNKFMQTIKQNLRSTDNGPVNVKYVFQKSSDPVIFGYFANKELSKHSLVFLSKKLAHHFNLFGIHFTFEKMSLSENKISRF